MKQRVMIGMALLLVTVLTGCDGAGDRKSMPENQGNGRWCPMRDLCIGQGRHAGRWTPGRGPAWAGECGSCVTIVSVPDGTEDRFRSNGDYRLLQVNGEERRPSRQNKN